jgi:hypothetical protein
MAHAAVGRTTHLKTVVGMFGSDRRAVEAMRSLDAAGFDADRVQLVADDPSRAAEVGGKTYAPQGAVSGSLVGIAVVAAFAVWGGLAADPIELIIGAVGVVGGFAGIGLVLGRTIGRHAPDARAFAGVVANGGAIVSVQCAADECELAAEVFDGAGAREVRDEPGAEAL